MSSTFVKLKRIVFLKDAFVLGLTAFGGPQMHFAMFLERLVKKKRYLTEDELMEINGLCQVLPGPSSTQTITAIGFKLGGPNLAFLTLLAWMLPGAIIMTILTISPKFLASGHLKFLQPMVIGFIAYASFTMYKLLRPDPVNYTVLILACAAGILIKSPMVFPICLVLGAMMSSNFGNREFVPNKTPFSRIRWANLSLFFGIFLFFALAGRISTFIPSLKPYSQPILLFENTYRTGSMVYGGGNALVPILLDQYVYHKQKITVDELNNGLGLVQALPGPNFNIGAYVNGTAMKNYGYGIPGQFAGSIIGLIAIFLPGTLLIFFFYPIWGKLKTYPIVQRSLDGIIAASVGMVIAAAVLLYIEFVQRNLPLDKSIISYGIIIATFVLLKFTKVPPPLIVIAVFLLGIFIV